MLKYVQTAALAVGLMLGSAEAVEVNHLNEADIPVNTRSSAELEQAIAAAMAKVMVKNSGSRDVLNNPAVQALIQSARSVLSQYGYEENDGHLSVRVSFDNERVTDTLRRAGLPVWGKQRPLTLLWLATEADGDTVLVGDQSDLQLRNQFTQISDQTGVPLLFPLLDLDDMMLANVNSVRGFFADEAAAASRRYQSDFFALATLDAAEGGFNYRLALYSKPVNEDARVSQAVNQISGTAASSDEAIAAILSGISSYYVSRYATSGTTAASETELVFAGIKGLKALVDIEKFLEQLSLVKSVRLVSIQGDEARYALTLFGTDEELSRTLALETKLEPLDANGVKGLAVPFPASTDVGHRLPNKFLWRGR